MAKTANDVLTWIFRALEQSPESYLIKSYGTDGHLTLTDGKTYQINVEENDE